MRSPEERWGAGFGSGRLVTPEVWEVISLLTRLPEGHRRGAEHILAFMQAWSNGCNRPEYNIQKNKGGALGNAYGDGRNNFLYGYIRALAKRKSISGASDLYHNIESGEEVIPEHTPIEEDHVPIIYRNGGLRSGFARSLPFEITSGIWNLVDATKESEKPNVFCDLLGDLEKGVAESDSLSALAKFMNLK